MECQDLMPSQPPIETQLKYSPTELMKLFWKYADNFISLRTPNVSGLTLTQIKWFSFKRALLCQKLGQRVYSNAFLDALLDNREPLLAEGDNIVSKTWKEVEHILSNNVGKKTVDQYWNRMKSVYGSDYRFTDKEIFDALGN